MNILRDITYKNIKLNKRRTIVTIIGIILSTALICCVAGMFTSFSKTMVNSFIEQDGDYHVELYEVNSSDISSIKSNKKISRVVLEKDKGYAISNEYGYLNLLAKDDNGLEEYDLYSGRLPENSNEIVVNYNLKNLLYKEIALAFDNNMDIYEELYSDDINYENIDLDEIIKKLTTTYKVVGVLSEKYYSNQILTKLDDSEEIVNVKIKYKNIRNTYKITEQEFSNYGYSYHQEVLNWSFVPRSDNSMKTLYMLVGIVLGIIVVSSVFVIRNSFEISITEKMRQFGMLASIGATKKQIRKAVLYEGLILGLIAIPSGILLGYLVIHILIFFSNVMLGDLFQESTVFVVSVPMFAIILSVVLGSFTILFSSLKSAYKAGKVSPITAIRSNNEIKIKNGKLKTPKIISKLFGIGGVVAYKNLKRSKKKYRTTVISLVVSITIFISLYSFMDTLFLVSKFVYKNIYFNIVVVNNTNDYSLTEDINDYYVRYGKQNREIIDKIIVERLNDGQLADSPLTLKDIKVIAVTFSRILRGMQHNRIKYQENIAEEFAKNKIEMPAKILDEDFEKKIKELEDSKPKPNIETFDNLDNEKTDL